MPSYPPGRSLDVKTRAIEARVETSIVAGHESVVYGSTRLKEGDIWRVRGEHEVVCDLREDFGGDNVEHFGGKEGGGTVG